MRVIRVSRKIVSLGIVALLLVPHLSVAAGDAGFVLRVDGLACPFCAYGVEKKILKLPAVEEMQILINEGKIILKLRKGERLDVVALNKAVDDAGFTLRKILVERLIGQLSRNDAGAYLLRSSEPPVAFTLSFANEESLKEVLSDSVIRTVSVSGEVTEYIPDPAPLIVNDMSPISPVATATP